MTFPRESQLRGGFIKIEGDELSLSQVDGDFKVAYKKI